jgi:hypothetical protein
VTQDLRLTTSFPAARAVAPRIRDHFAAHIDSAAARGQIVADVPPIDAIEAMIEAAFWASLRREEGYIPKVSLAYLAPARAANPLRFARPLPLDAAALTRVAPAVERAGIHLGVERDGDRWIVWGTARTLPRFCFVLEAAAPGLLVVKHQRGEPGKFVNVAVIEGDRIKVVDEDASSLPDCPPLLESLLGFESPRSWVNEVNVLVQLAVSMRSHGRGGVLLVVPPDSDAWRESIIHPISYGIEPAFTGLAKLAVAKPSGDADQTAWQQKLGRAIDAIAGLTAVDGAAIISRRYDVLAFGAKITRRRGSPPVEQVAVTEPIEGGSPAVMHPSQLGGTRHLSAAQFVHDQRDTLALVASQDGRFTVFAWSPCEGMVHAHRVEVLLI